MSDATTAAEGSGESTETEDFFELGNVSTETRGGFGGGDYDGYMGWWTG